MDGFGAGRCSDMIFRFSFMFGELNGNGTDLKLVDKELEFVSPSSRV